MYYCTMPISAYNRWARNWDDQIRIFDIAGKEMESGIQPSKFWTVLVKRDVEKDLRADHWPEYKIQILYERGV